MTAVALFGSSALLLGTSFVEDPTVNVALISLSLAFAHLNTSGSLCNAIELSPRYSAIVSSIMTMVGKLSGIVAPMVIAAFTNGDPSREQYRKVFILTGVFTSVCACMFLIFGSGKTQAWDDPDAAGWSLKNQTDQL